MKHLSFLALATSALVNSTHASRHPTYDASNFDLPYQENRAPARPHLAPGSYSSHHHSSNSHESTQPFVGGSAMGANPVLMRDQIPEYVRHEIARLYHHQHASAHSQYRSPTRLSEQLRHEQMRRQQPQTRENLPQSTQVSYSRLPYAPSRGVFTTSVSRSEELKNAKMTEGSAVPPITTYTNPSNASEQLSYSNQRQGDSDPVRRNLSFPPLKPVPIHPPINPKLSVHNPHSLTLRELYELAPIVVTRSLPAHNALVSDEQIRSEAVEYALSKTPMVEPTVPADYEKIVFYDGFDQRIPQETFLQSLDVSFRKHLNPQPNHQNNPIFHSLVQEKKRLEQMSPKRIQDFMNLAKIERGIPMMSFFGTPENFDFVVKTLMNSLYDPRVLPSRRFMIFTLLTCHDYYGRMLDLYHHTQLKRIEDRILKNTIFRLAHFSKETPVKALTQVEKSTHPSFLRSRPYIMGAFMERDADTKFLSGLFKTMNIREIMGEETSAHSRAYTFNALMESRTAPFIRALSLHFKANRILFELQSGRWLVTNHFNAETARQCLELAYHCLESLSFQEIEDATLRQQKIALKQTLLYEINEDANALRFLFTLD